MNDQRLSELITREIERALREVEFSAESFKIIAVLTHFGQGLDKLIEALASLAMKNIPVLVWTTKELDKEYNLLAVGSKISALKVEVQDTREFVIKTLDKTEAIIFGAFSFEIADKIIKFQDQEPVVNILLQGLLHEIPVYILTPCPITDIIFEYKPSSRINQELRKRLSLLSEMGFNLVDEGELGQDLIKQPVSHPELITESYIEKIRGKSRELRISKSTVVTPLAKEKASDLKIRIIRI
ncbi:MAG: hypothetical protein ACTSW1_12495 [Candidatus Hodarchaeales archaeon]